MRTLLAALFLACATQARADEAPERFRFDTNGAPEVSVEAVGGSIDISGSDGAEVTVEAVRSGREAARWTVEVQGGKERVTARVCCGSCGRSVHRNCEGEAEVRFVLHVPRKARVSLSSVSADIRVQGVAGAAQVETVSGKVALAGSAARVEVHTVSGDVTLSPVSAAETHVNSVSGDLKLKLPANADATVSLSTVSGSLDGARGGNRRVLGKGTARIEVDTVSGGVRLD